METILSNMILQNIHPEFDVLAKAKESELFVKDSTEPEEYITELKLSIVRYGSLRTNGPVYGDEILYYAKVLNCTAGKKMAGILYANREQIPEDWRKYKFTFPGTIWDCPKVHRGLTSFVWSEKLQDWEISFIGIDSFNDPEKATFVRVEN